MGMKIPMFPEAVTAGRDDGATDAPGNLLPFIDRATQGYITGGRLPTEPDFPALESAMWRVSVNDDRLGRIAGEELATRGRRLRAALVLNTVSAKTGKPRVPM